MLLIVDAEVIFAALIKRGFTLDLIRLLKDEHKLVTPEYIFEEVVRKKEKLLRYSKLSEGKLLYVLFLVLGHISHVSEDEYIEFSGQAEEISPFEDIPYAALALKYLSSGLEPVIWSNDPKLKKALKGKIIVLTTPELLKRLGL